MLKKRFLPFAILFSLLFTMFLHATTVQRLEFDDLVKKAQRIVIGKVRSSRTHWSDNGKLILTSYTIDVAETIKGQPGRTIEITAVGGKIGDLELFVSGVPSFEAGEDAVVFVEQSGAYQTVVGLGQGKFTVKNGEVSNNVHDLSFPDGRPGTPLRMSVETFKTQIKALVSRQQ